MSKKYGIPLAIDEAGDVLFDQHSLQASKEGVQQMLEAIDCLNGGSNIALTLGRPPGHHADAKSASGFCILNKIAITAASQCIQNKKILIVDFDVHDGNGTASCLKTFPNLFNKNNVKMFNFFEENLYPSRDKSEIAEENKNGMIKSFALPKKTTSEKILRLIKAELAILKTESFLCDFILVSFGVDGHIDDPLGNFNLNDNFFVLIIEILAQLSKPILMTLEGGYNLEVIKNIINKLVNKLPEISRNIKLLQQAQKFSWSEQYGAAIPVVGRTEGSRFLGKRNFPASFEDSSMSVPKKTMLGSL